MDLVLDIWHGVSTLDKFLHDFKVVVLPGFKALAVVKNELFVVARDYFLVDVGYACV